MNNEPLQDAVEYLRAEVASQEFLIKEFGMADEYSGLRHIAQLRAAVEELERLRAGKT